MNSRAPDVNDVDVDLGRLLASVRRDWRRILLVSLVVAAAVFVLLLLVTPLYRAETRVLIETRESVYTRPQAAGTNSDSAILDEEGVASQVEVITSSEVLTRVARELNLASREEFKATDSLLERTLITVGLKSPSSIPPEERVLRAFREKLNVYRVEDSRVIVIQFSSEDPELAAQVVNAVADAYVANQREAKLQSNVDATEWLEPEIADLSERVREAEARVAEFRAQSDLLIGRNNTVLATQQLAELSSELSRVRVSRSAAEAKAESVRAAIESGVPPETLPDVLASGLIQRLRERQVELQAEIAELSTTLLDNHPRIRALRSQLSDLDTQIRAESEKVLAGLETEAGTARRREEELAAEVERLKAESARAEEQQVELRALERQAAAQRELLESYLTRYREAAARRDRNYLPVDARIFSRAIVPSESYFPKVGPLTLAAFAATLLLMLIFTLLKELFSGRALRPAEGALEAESTDMPVLAPAVAEEETETVEGEAAPAATPPPTASTAEPKQGTGAEASRPYRSRSLGEIDIEMAAEALISKGIARAIFVSPEGDEAAATAVLVAREVADAGLRVLLIDLTASGAASRPMLESAAYAGITNLLAARAQFADVIHADLYSSCHIIPVGTADPEHAMRGFDRLPIILNSLTIAYDVVVVECGAADAAAVKCLMGDDAQVLVSVLDPQENRVTATAAALADGGLGKPLLVTPAGYVPPSAPPGRDAA